MHDEHPHPLLAQIPLTVSPFLSLPSATTLPYTYKTLPSTLPPSLLDHSPSASTDPTALNTSLAPGQKPSYVISGGGHSAHPDDIIANCRALQTHLETLGKEARDKVGKWESAIRERELAEKRRVAPGWLDEEVRLLVPERKGDGIGVGAAGEVATGQRNSVQESVQASVQQQSTPVQSREGEELDRAFGGLNVR